MKKIILILSIITITITAFGQKVIDLKACKGEIIKHAYYTVCLNDSEHVPNWVCYHLTKKESVNAVGERKNAFATDKASKFSATPSDYHLSGYDQGHLFSWSSNQWNDTAAVQCFYMTNMAPQIHTFNAGTWEKIENLERDARDKIGDVYYIAGVLKFNQRIGKNKVGVPEIWWKVFVDFKHNQEIAFVFYKSDNYIIHPISVTDLEKIIQLNITPDVSTNIESKFDLNYWNYPTGTKHK